MKRLELPLGAEALAGLRAGDKVLVSGILYTARDAAHKRLAESIVKGEPLVLDLKEQAIYYVGPAPAKDGAVIGPAGPTTSGRMDAFTPMLLQNGLKIMIGKGRRSQAVRAAIKAHGAVYFAAIGGAAAIMMKSIESACVVAYEDLGTEAIRRLEVKDMPLIVAIDSAGNDYYDIGPANYLYQSTFGEDVE